VIDYMVVPSGFEPELFWSRIRRVRNAVLFYRWPQTSCNITGTVVFM